MKRILPSFRAAIVFEAAARHSSFTRAAEELGLTQSAVSRQISQLESFLGVRLFERIRKNVVLTEVGANYADNIRISLDRAEAATLDLLTSVDGGGLLRIASLATFASLWLAPRLVGFVKSHPDIAFQLSTYQHKTFDFTANDPDIVIHYGEPSWPNGIVNLLMGEEIVPVCTREYMIEKKLREPGDLQRATLIQQTTRPDAWEDWLAAAGTSAVYPLHGPRFEQYSMIIEGALSGLGVGAVPYFLVEGQLAAGTLVLPFDIRVASRLSYYLVYPESKRNLNAIQAFRWWIMREAQATNAAQHLLRQ